MKLTILPGWPGIRFDIFLERYTQLYNCLNSAHRDYPN